MVESQPSKLSRFAGVTLSEANGGKPAGEIPKRSEGPRRVSGSNSVVESQPSKLLVVGSIPISRSSYKGSEADVAQLVEHSLGKGEVIGSIPIISSSFQP